MKKIKHTLLVCLIASSAIATTCPPITARNLEQVRSELLSLAHEQSNLVPKGIAVANGLWLLNGYLNETEAQYECTTLSEALIEVLDHMPHTEFEELAKKAKIQTNAGVGNSTIINSYYRQHAFSFNDKNKTELFTKLGEFLTEKNDTEAEFLSALNHGAKLAESETDRETKEIKERFWSLLIQSASSQVPTLQKKNIKTYAWLCRLKQKLNARRDNTTTHGKLARQLDSILSWARHTHVVELVINRPLKNNGRIAKL
ncbi:MAG: hypothetical protein H6679_00465 [Epsilonproteobacteria bacterium]|nr:hypothetical protein [Campylobacterota bacterium]